MKEVELSARMRALTDMVSKQSIVCDVGCDHGFVSIYLVQQGIAPKVYAMDVGKGPLERAKEHIKEYDLETYIETRLSDGLEALQTGEADCMICAGMGGRLMMRILQEGSDKAHAMKELILQPQSDLTLFRAFLRSDGYKITQENMIYEDGKYYPMMKVVPVKSVAMPRIGRVGAEQPMSKAVPEYALWDMFGELLLKEGHPILKQYLAHSEGYLSELLAHLEAQGGERAKERVQQIQEELRMVKKAQAYMTEW